MALPKARIDPTIQLNHHDCLKNLGKYRHSLRSQRKFWTDVALLDRLNYKNHNQHRHFHRFKRTCEARRLLKRFKGIELDKRVDELYSLFYNESPIEKCTGSSTSIPPRDICEQFMQQLIAASVLLDKLQVVLVEVYREYSTLLKLEHFVSMALVHMGICARLYTLSHKWVKELEDFYDLIQGWHLAFPYSSKSAPRYPCAPSTLKDERSKASQWNKNRISFKHPVHFEYFLTHQLADDPLQSLQQQQSEIDNKDKNTVMKDESMPFLTQVFGASGDLEDEDDLGDVIARE